MGCGREKRAEETSWRLRGDAQARKLAVGLSSYRAGGGHEACNMKKGRYFMTVNTESPLRIAFWNPHVIN